MGQVVRVHGDHEAVPPLLWDSEIGGCQGGRHHFVAQVLHGFTNLGSCRLELRGSEKSWNVLNDENSGPDIRGDVERGPQGVPTVARGELLARDAVGERGSPQLRTSARSMG